MKVGLSRTVIQASYSFFSIDGQMEMELVLQIKDQKGMMMFYIRGPRREPETFMSHSYELHSSLHITYKEYMKGDLNMVKEW